MIYPEQRGDYFPKTWNATEFNSQFDLLMDNESFLAATEVGFVQLNLLEKIGQFVKGFFGGTDYSQKQRVQAAWLKFLYYGEAHGFLHNDHIDQMQHRIKYPAQFFDPAIHEMVKNLRNYHHASDISHSDHLDDLREMISIYHHQQAFHLRPGFWRRLLSSPPIDCTKLTFFGDTPLSLCQKALKRKVPQPLLALTHLENAFKLKNNTPAFQEKLAEQLDKLEKSFASNLRKQTANVQTLWIKLGETAFENELPDLAETYLTHALEIDAKNMRIRQQVGRVYLSNKEYTLAQPFLSELQKAFPQDLPLQIEIGHAYWEAKQFDEAKKAYETALIIFNKQPGKFIPNQAQVASAQHQIGMAHLQKRISHGTTADAILFLSQAVKLDPTRADYQENLCEAYAQEWQSAEENFGIVRGEQFLKSLHLFQTSAIKKKKEQILNMLLDCSEDYFKSHENKKAHVFLEKALVLYKDDPDVKCEVLDVAVRFGDWSSFEPRLAGWEKEHPSNPFLKKKIADAYWNSDKSHALKMYQTSLELFEKGLSHCENEEQSRDYEHHIAAVQARIGQSHLHTKAGFWKGISYDDAIKSLEKAKALQPERYSSLLFEAHLSAAQAEKEKLWGSKTKIIAHYNKAFEICPQNGDYLIEFFELCIEHHQHETAIVVYKRIQEESWAEEFELPAAVYSELAIKFLELKDYKSTLACLKQAYELDPDNQQYKHEYFQFTLTLAHKGLKKLNKTAKEEKKDVTVNVLKIVENLEACWKDGANKVKKLEKPYQDMFVKVYTFLAECYLQVCLLPEPEKQMYKGDVKEHKAKHKKEIEQALNAYDKALGFQPDNAALHFDKGVLLDWIIDYDEARKEFELAVQHQPRNPFYHKMLAPLYMIVSPINPDKYKLHDELVTQYASSTFREDFETWTNEFMYENRKPIAPHSYTQKKGWWH